MELETLQVIEKLSDVLLKQSALNTQSLKCLVEITKLLPPSERAPVVDQLQNILNLSSQVSDELQAFLNLARTVGEDDEH